MQDLDGFSEYDISEELASTMGGNSVMSSRNSRSRRPGLPPMPSLGSGISRTSSKQNQPPKPTADHSGALSEQSAGGLSDRGPSTAALQTASSGGGEGQVQGARSEPLSELRTEQSDSITEDGPAASCAPLLCC
jgi:hypothetical protein